MLHQMLAGVRHDALTPLTSLRMVLDLLQRESDHLDSQSAREMLQRAQRSVLLLQAVVESIDVLDPLSKTAGPPLAPLNLELLAEQVLSMSRSLLEARGQTVHLQVQPGATWAMGIEYLSQRSFLNVLSNAAKYGADGDTIDVQLKRHKQYVRLSVTDHGAGIPRADRPHLFDWQYRGSAADTPEVAGSGLGLYLVKRFMELQGGRVGVQSRVGRGSTFWLEFPVGHTQEGER